MIATRVGPFARTESVRQSHFSFAHTLTLPTGPQQPTPIDCTDSELWAIARHYKPVRVWG